MVFSGKEDFTAVHNRVAVGELVNMPVKDDPFSDEVRIIKIITSLHIITDVVSDDYFIGITRQVYVGKDVHIML